MKVALVHFGESGARRDFMVEKPLCRVGRKPESDLQIPAPTVSREHCEIRVEGGRLLVRDLGSSNGTFRNGHRFKGEMSFEAGDRLTIGSVTLTVVVDGQPANVEPPSSADHATVSTAFESPKTAPAHRPTAMTPTRAGPRPATKKASSHDSGDIADLLANSGDDSSVFDFDIDSGDDKP